VTLRRWAQTVSHDGEIVHYDDYLDPVAMLRLLSHTEDLVAALTAA
jgi:hypothetical protein